MFCDRCGTLVSVERKIGANGLSLPSWAYCLKSALMMPGRFRLSAIAWRTSLLSHGAWSQRIDSSRCCDDFDTSRL